MRHGHQSLAEEMRRSSNNVRRDHRNGFIFWNETQLESYSIRCYQKPKRLNKKDGNKEEWTKRISMATVQKILGL
jgi:hypothetical protein